MTRIATITACLFLLFSFFPSCSEPEKDDPTKTESLTGGLDNPGEIENPGSDIDRIPDFSRVGYHYGDRPIPTVKEVCRINQARISDALAKGRFKDTTDFLQGMIDSVGNAGGGAILLANGSYNFSRMLFIDSDNVVLRGEDREKTILKSNGKLGRQGISIGKTVPWTSSYADSLNVSGRRVVWSKLTAAGAGGASSFGTYTIVQILPKGISRQLSGSTKITEDYVPVGRMYLEVADAGQFAPGDRIVICRPHSDAWITDIGMDRIASNGREAVKSPTVQWSTRDYSMKWERKVTDICGSRLYLDAPIVQSIDSAYGGGTVSRCSMERVSECGVENLTIDSSYNPSLKKGSDFIDEAHTWSAIQTHNAEHCWIRDVDCYHMAYALAALQSGSRCITVENCNSREPVSVISGARRYAFNFSGSELCLIKGCTCDNDRHGCVTNGCEGPNVFTKCKGTHMRSVMGPHQGWATGTLYDRISSDGSYEIQDRGNYGTGHGWAAANDVFWNIECTGGDVICQNPWSKQNTPSLSFASAHPSGQNWSIGTIGLKNAGRNYKKDYYGNPTTDWYIDVMGIPTRPDGCWYPEVEVGACGTSHVILPDTSAAAAYEWWPEFTITSFSDPLSLYECQLEDRHARGIDLSTL